MMTPLLCLAVLLSATLIDYAHARCVLAIHCGARHRAARWSVLQWAGATLGFVIAVKVTFWVLPFEAAGLYIGTLLAVRSTEATKPSAKPTTLAESLSQTIDLDPIIAALSSSQLRRAVS